MELPLTPSPAKRVNPKQLVIFGKPKCGKTTITAGLTLTGKWLLIELETEGADFVEATKVQCNNLGELVEVGKAITAAKHPYEGVIVDSVTKLEDMCLPYAAQLYKASPMGINWTGSDVRTLANGAGYLYLRNAFQNMVNTVFTFAPNIIYIGHLSDKLIDKKGEEVSSKELDLTGKISKIMCANVDAIAYCYRKDNQTLLNFKSSEEVVCGSRCEHLRGQEIVIAESDEKNQIKTHWDKIYL